MLDPLSTRFPNSALLFTFCKELMIFQNDSRVTDQDVGLLLDFDPADCTHWKHGRKNIKNVQYINLISKKLEIDHKTIMDILSGRKNWEECLKIYTCDTNIECSKLDRNFLLEEAKKLLENGQMKTLPILTNEIVSLYPNIVLKREEWEGYGVMKTFNKDGKYIIMQKTSVQEDIYLRYLVTLEFSKIYLQKQPFYLKLNLLHIEQHSRLFSLFLLMPTELMQIAISQCDPAKDLIEHLSSLFWLSRNLVNMRIKDFIQNH